VRSYFFDTESLGVEQALDRLLPRRRNPWVLFGPDDAVIATFTGGDFWRATASVHQSGAVFHFIPHIEFNSSIQADIAGDGLDDRILTIRILRAVRDRCGGVIRDEDGVVID